MVASGREPSCEAESRASGISGAHLDSRLRGHDESTRSSAAPPLPPPGRPAHTAARRPCRRPARRWCAPSSWPPSPPAAWPLLHLVAGLDGERHDLARHGRGEAAAFGVAFAGMRQQVDGDDRVAPCGVKTWSVSPLASTRASVRWPANCRSMASPRSGEHQRPGGVADRERAARRRAGSAVRPPPARRGTRMRSGATRRRSARQPSRRLNGSCALERRAPRAGCGPRPPRRRAAARPAPGGTAPPARAGSARCRDRPGRTSGCCTTWRRNCTLVARPTMCVRASASSRRASACSRVAPCTISLAIIES